MKNKTESIQFDLHISGNKLKILILPGSYQKNENYVTSYHYHTEYEIHYILSGSFAFNVGDKQYICNSKSLFILPPDRYHTIRSFGAGVKICFQCRILKNGKIPFVFGENEVSTNYDMPEAELFVGILSEFRKNDSEHNLLKLKAITEIIMLNINDTVLKNSKPNEKDNAVVEADVIERCLTYINNNYGRSIHLSDLCAELFISERQATRILKSETNRTFVQLLTEHRINTAKKLIKENKMTVSEISEAVGFTTYSGFWKAFSNCAGISPNDYKKQVL